MATETKLVTAKELESMPETDEHIELVSGVIVRMPPASESHGSIAWSVAQPVAVFLAQNPVGQGYIADTGFALTHDPDTVRAPDFAFVSAKRLAGRPPRQDFFDGAPDLAVEVVSPDDKDSDVQDKVLEYLNAGTQFVWVLRPRQQTVTVHRSVKDVRVLTIDDRLDGEDVLPGFALLVRNIFER